MYSEAYEAKTAAATLLAEEREARKAAKLPKPETMVLACPRVKLKPTQIPGVFHARGGVLPPNWIEDLEQNQQIASCCRHPENHDIEAFKSHPDETAPDIYIFHCTCGRKHRRFCVGGSSLETGKGLRPFWK